MASKGGLVTLIEEHADELTTKWLEVVRTHPDMPTYRTYDEKLLYDRAFSVYSQLGKWLSDETTKEEIKDIYFTLGRRRKEEGFKLSELLLALIINRRVLWLKIPKGDLLESVSDLHAGMRLSNNTILFFDRAMFYTAQGYEAS
jgi:hypothetical protein